MTTPYGVTTFAYDPPGSGLPRFVQVTDPLAYNEREEWLEPAPVPCCDPPATVPVGMPLPPTNALQYYRGSFHWDKDAYVAAGCTPTGGCDYTKARYTRFAHAPIGIEVKSTTVENIKYPLENRIWYEYPNQTYSFYAGSYMGPMATARVLDDGTTQLSQATYDTTGYYKLTQSIDPVGRVTSFSYGANRIDLLTVSQTVSGSPVTVAQYTYNTQHRPLTAIDAAGQTTTYTYNPAGQLATVINPLSQTTTYNYDTSANLTSIVNANSVTAASYTYDAFDRVATATDSEGWTVGYSYDAADRITKIAYPDGTSQNYAYNKLDLASFQDRLGRIWTYNHDANRRLTAITDPAGKQTLFAYNGQGEITSRTDPGGNFTQWSYDLEGRLTTKTYADSSTATSTYEATTSRLKSTTDALGQTNQFSYAQDNLPSGVTHLSAVNPTPNVSFAYDPYFARITSMTDGTGTTTYAYVPVGTLGALQVQNETPPSAGGGSIAYVYDALGRLSSRTVPGSGAETLGYDAIGRLTSHGSDLGTFALAYLGQTGQVTSRQLTGASLATTWTYLPNSGDRRLAGVSTAGLSAGQSTGFTFTTNAEDEITASTQASDATISYPPGSLTQTASYNNLNQLTNLSGQALTWDADGNLLSDGARTYSWDAENRLVGISYPGQPGKATALAYDGFGRLVSISSTPAGGGAAVVTGYVWCGERPCQAQGAGGTVARAYYAEGEFIPGSPAQSDYYGPDQIQSVRRVFTSGSAPAYDYDPYGVALQAAAPVTDFNYAGTFYNADSGLYLATYRAYDPIAGRWLSRDPTGEGSDTEGNLYAYVAGDPLNFHDPMGLFGAGIIGSGSIEGGIGIAGAGATKSFGGGLFGGGGQGLNIGGFSSFGSFGRFINCVYQKPINHKGLHNDTFAIGAFAGAGVGIFLTNANKPSDLKGPFDNYSANIGEGPAQLSLQIGVDGNGTGIISVTVGPGVGLNVSGYPTNTTPSGK